MLCYTLYLGQRQKHSLSEKEKKPIIFTHVFNVASEWEQPLLLCGAYQANISERARVKKVLWTFDS